MSDRSLAEEILIREVKKRTLYWLLGGGLTVVGPIVLIAAFILGMANMQSPSHGSTPSSPLGPTNTNIGIPTQTVKPWLTAIQAASKATGVPADWIAAEMIHESRGNPHAGILTRAYGLMQLEPGTMGATTADRINPAANVLYGAKLLAANYSLFHSWWLASAAYYGGAGSVDSVLAHHGLQVPLPWSQAQLALSVVPQAQYGNTLTLAQYADDIYQTALQLGGKG